MLVIEDFLPGSKGMSSQSEGLAQTWSCTVRNKLDG